MTEQADLGLKPYCTARQWEVMNVIASAGSLKKASEVLGIARSAVQRARASVLKKAAQQGYAPDHDLVHPVPDGFKLKGASTLYDAITGEAKIQWVKSEADKARQHEMFLEMVKEMVAYVPPAEVRDGPIATSSQLMAVYPVGDHHLGMLSWDKETGDDYDLTIGAALLRGATQYLFNAVPACKQALIAILGDFLHYDGFEAVTPTSRNQLDADSRFPKMVRAAIKALRDMIELALDKHEHVHVIVEVGNHDLASSIWLMELLHNIYQGHPRVTVDTSPMHYHYYRFGNSLIGTHHGHGAKMEQLPLIMAADRPLDWGATKYRMWLTGHVHHSKNIKAATARQDFVGCEVESFRILAPSDAWAHQRGYRSASDMHALVFHEETGLKSRHMVNPDMLRGDHVIPQ